MTKKQKIWLKLFLAMFFVPEILFSVFSSSLSFLFFRADLPYLLKVWPGERFLLDNSFYVFSALIVQIIGLFGLLKYNIKFNASRFKSVFTFLLLIVIFLGFLVIYAGGVMSRGIGF